jgi:hypothetical protein
MWFSLYFWTLFWKRECTACTSPKSLLGSLEHLSNKFSQANDEVGHVEFLRHVVNRSMVQLPSHQQTSRGLWFSLYSLLVPLRPFFSLLGSLRLGLDRDEFIVIL